MGRAEGVLRRNRQDRNGKIHDDRSHLPNLLEDHRARSRRHSRRLRLERRETARDDGRRPAGPCEEGLVGELPRERRSRHLLPRDSRNGRQVARGGRASEIVITRGAAPLGLPHTLSRPSTSLRATLGLSGGRAPLRRRAPFAWLARDADPHVSEMASTVVTRMGAALIVAAAWACGAAPANDPPAPAESA